MESLRGHLLVASPHLADPNFQRTVVLLIHHSEEGTFGVVLNRPASRTIKELWESVGGNECQAEQCVHVGGPVSGPIMAIHTDQSLSELEILPGLYFAANRKHIERLLNQTEHPFRMFIGHSGWGSGQIERELKEGSWFTLRATLDYVFADESEVWRTASQAVGQSLLGSMLKLDRIPDHSLN